MNNHVTSCFRLLGRAQPTAPGEVSCQKYPTASEYVVPPQEASRAGKSALPKENGGCPVGKPPVQRRIWQTLPGMTQSRVGRIDQFWVFATGRLSFATRSAFDMTSRASVTS